MDERCEPVEENQVLSECCSLGRGDMKMSAGIFVRDSQAHLVSPRCPTAVFKRRTSSPPRGLLKSHADLACASRKMRMEYCIIF